MSLSKTHRDALPDSDFAVPRTRDLPMHDATHTKMAWKMVDKTKGLSPEQRKEAKSRILKRAKEQNIDTTNWNMKADADDAYLDEEQDQELDDKEKRDQQLEDGIEDEEMNSYEEDELRKEMQSMKFEGMSLEMPDIAKHPNRAPFSGVLTRLDEPSDNPLSGSNGKLVILPKDVAEKALSSLLGMCVDFTKNFDGHDVKQKIGLIDEANIVGNEIHISGFFYCADYPEEFKRIQAEKSQLGFSYEAQAQLRSMNDDPLVMKNCVFTGAAVLYKDKAAYTTTSLSAKKTETFIMSDEMKKQFEEMQSKIAKLEVDLAAANTKLSAGSIAHLIKPHSDAIRSCAAKMEAAGIGMHAKMGHVAALHSMADQMDAEAALGKMPHVYQTMDFLNASSDKKETSKEMTELKSSLEDITSKLVDLEKARFAAAASPERKTLDPAMKHLLAKAGIKPSDDNEKMSIAAVDEALSKTKGTTINQRMQAKLGLQQAGKI